MRVFLIVLFALSVNENAVSSNNSIEGYLLPLVENAHYPYYVALANCQNYLTSGGIILSPYWVLTSNYYVREIAFVCYGSSNYSSLKQKSVTNDRHTINNIALVKVDIPFDNIEVPKLPNQSCKDFTATQYRLIFWLEDQRHGCVMSTLIDHNLSSVFNGIYHGMGAGSAMVINDVEIYGVKLENIRPFTCICNSLGWIKNITNLK